MRLFIGTLFVAVLLLGGCEDSSTGPGDDFAIFVIEVVDEEFRIRLEDPALIAQARRILNGQEAQKIVIGRLATGDGGFNDGWSWHLLPEETEFAEAAIELCDGLPSHVEGDLNYWLNTVEFYCPWAARVVAEST